MTAGARTRIERLSPANARPTLEYLSRSPYENVFLTYLAIEGTLAMQRDVYVVSEETGEVAGVGFLGRQIVLAAEPASAGILAQRAARTRERAIVGPREAVRAYWESVRARHVPPRLVRERQPVMAVDEASLRDAGAVAVRRARDDEWRDVAANSAAMIAGELETNPRRDAEFDGGIRKMIRLGLWWVGESEGRLCFFCNVGAWSPQTVQLQGIWAPPEFRGRGLATAALGKICRTLLKVAPTLSLYVNDFNAPAIALYRRLGFRGAGELQTILF